MITMEKKKYNSKGYCHKLKKERQLTTLIILTQKDKRDYYSEQGKPKIPMSRDIGSQLQTNIYYNDNRNESKSIISCKRVQK